MESIELDRLAANACRQMPPSVVRLLNEAIRRTHAVLGEIATGSCVGARGKLDGIARLVTDAVTLQPDVAQACILHNRQAGPYPVRHSVDVAVVSLLAAGALERPPAELARVTLAALTMNVGMLDQQECMQCTRSPLAIEEACLIRDHPLAAVRLLQEAGIDDPALLDCVLAHHECEDGSGYPAGRRGREIPELAKIVALADRYCARISARSYREPVLPSHALRDILLERKDTVDMRTGALFVRELGVYPVGTAVRLLNGEAGIVTRRGANPGTPIVGVLVNSRGTPLGAVQERDTRQELHSIRAVLTELPGMPGFKLAQLWGEVAAP